MMQMECDNTTVLMGQSRQYGKSGIMVANGFTLIELLVVIAIISLLVSILLPSLSKARSLARMAVCSMQLNGLGTATALYMADNNDSYPVIMDIYGTMGVGNPAYGSPRKNLPDFYMDAGLVDSKAMFHCPEADESVTASFGYDYVYSSWSANIDRRTNKSPRTIEDVCDMSVAVLIYDYTYQHPLDQTKNILYLDWHINYMSRETYLVDYGGSYDLWINDGWYD